MSNKKKTITKKADSTAAAPKDEKKAPAPTQSDTVATIKAAHLKAVADLRAQYRKDVAAIKR